MRPVDLPAEREHLLERPEDLPRALEEDRFPVVRPARRDERPGALETGRFQVFGSQASPNVVQVTSEDQWRSLVNAQERATSQEALELYAALTRGKLAGVYGGSVLGSGAGGYAGYRRNASKNYYKPVKAKS